MGERPAEDRVVAGSSPALGINRDCSKPFSFLFCRGLFPSKAPKVFVLVDWLKVRGYAESTIGHVIDDLLCLARKGLDLDNPKQVFEYINQKMG